ncbi:hypothetical protein C8J56DRAFT_883440 [Mycena floridula]|nr:hypothetical protein C8J56DRAFT_883440 [Mycena floridula]
MLGHGPRDFLFPYLNLEDLSINNGTQGHFGIISGGIVRYHAIDCTMVGFGDPSTYGRILKYGEVLDSSDSNSREGAELEHYLREGVTVHQLVIALILLVQMKFLLAVVCKISVDLDLSEPSPAAIILPPPTIPIPDTPFQWKSSARTNTLRPYGLPPAFSIERIATLVHSQYESAIQHLADLRTDPMYLADTLQSYYDPRLETLIPKAPPKPAQNRAASSMLADAYAFLVYYHLAKALIEDFQVIQARYPNGLAGCRPTSGQNVWKNAFQTWSRPRGTIRRRKDKLAEHRPKTVERQKPSPEALLPFGGAAQTLSGPTKDQSSPAKSKSKTRRNLPLKIKHCLHQQYQSRIELTRSQVALQQGSVAWKDLLVAFSQVNFELEQTCGSAWTFSHPDGKGSVTVHEPHPESVMRVWEARRFGRRLTRRFGWTLESFVLDTAQN